MRILRAADRVAVPWKNGGGVTREVAIWPPSATVDDFDWRISIAEVRSAGPFSIFENIDRTIAILDGRLTLALDGRVVELDGNSLPFPFPGDVSCAGAPIDGPVTDLNVMTRRGRCSARVEPLSVLSQSGNVLRSVIVARTASMVDAGAEQIALEAHDALLIEGHVAARLISGVGFRIFLAGR